MNGVSTHGPLSDIQAAADLLIEAAGDEQQGAEALEMFSSLILERFGEKAMSSSKDRMFSPELTLEAQRFSAIWLIWILSQNGMSLQFGDTERLTASLCERAIPDIYPPEISDKQQTFQKLQALETLARSVMTEAHQLIDRTLYLNRMEQFREDVLRFLNSDSNKPFLEQLLPWTLVNSETQHLFSTVIDYVRKRDVPAANLFDIACNTCNAYMVKADEYGSRASSEILASLAGNLLSSITREEEKSRPNLRFSAMEKRYPLTDPGMEVVFYISVENTGTGPARDLKLETLCTYPSLIKMADPSPVLTLRTGESVEFRITGTISDACEKIDLEIRFSWRSNSGQEEYRDDRFTFTAQKDDVDWDLVSYEQPYDHTAPVTSTDNLYGREAELSKLVRTAVSPTVGSAYLFGQKRVGKTSLANALAEKLKVMGRKTGKDWIVIYVGSGDFIMVDAVNTFTQLGASLFNQLRRRMEERNPNIAEYPIPDFTRGLAPLSIFIDHILDADDDSLRVLFILDEFDDIPIEFLRRTALASALFQPIRQISSKSRCGFLLVGGENMEQLMVLQGDRLNKFEAIRIDYLNRPEFADLIREPVKHWLTITDEGLEVLYQCCSGNPFYAKLLAAELRDNMVERKDSDASRKDVEDAIARKTKDIAANSFAHFWMDGILPDSVELEKIQTARRFVLTAAGQILRDDEPLTRNRIVERAKQSRDRTLLEADYYAALDDLTVRKIITVNNDEVDMKMPLFRNWLMQTGSDMILPDSMQRLYVTRRQEEEDRHKVTDDEIFKLCAKLDEAGRRIELPAVRDWLSRFGKTRDQRLMFDLLQGMNIYGRNLTRAKMREAYGIVMREMPSSESVGGFPGHGGILVSCLDESPAMGGIGMCRLFAGENGLNSDSFVYVSDLERAIARRRKVKRLVLIDDFAGTGGTLIKALTVNLATLKRANTKGVRIIIVVVAGFVNALTEVSEFIKGHQLDAVVHFCDSLGEEYMAFSDRSRVFPNPNDRNLAKEVAERKGVALFREHPLGYRGSQALVAFDEHCPNNTLPILWSNKNGWPALFPRLGV